MKVVIKKLIVNMICAEPPKPAPLDIIIGPVSEKEK